MTSIELWTDGSGLATGGPGGWAFVLVATGRAGEVLRYVEASGGIPAPCTNQRAELTAVIQGLRALERPAALSVVSDSEYVVHGFTHGWVARWQRNGWRNRDDEPVANHDLWTALADATQPHTITWRHVRGHARIYRCTRCEWAGDEPTRRNGRRKVWCPACDMPAEAIDKHPHNARCDELAGAERRKLLQPAGSVA